MQRDRTSIAVMLCVTGATLALTDNFTNPKSLIAWGLCAIGWALAIGNARKVDK